MSSSNTPAPSLSYRDAGVDIDAGERLVERIKPFAARTHRDGVLAGIGGFGALFQLSTKFREPVLVSGTDGVGTKLKLAFQLGQHETVGIDLVAMSVNDVLAQGAEPLFFLDYFACGQLDVDVAARVIQGVARGCEQAGCALMGGETAEMPDMYPPGEYDLAGFAVGVVEKARIIDGRTIRAGDAVIGLASSGLHSNGYSLVRRIAAGADLASPFDGQTLGAVLMTPTRIYVKSILALMNAAPVKGLAHITGGGLTENVPRILPDGTCAVMHSDRWTVPPIFAWLKGRGNIAEREMYRTFNCGIGMVVVVAAADAARALQHLAASGETATLIGEIRTRGAGEGQAIIE